MPQGDYWVSDADHLPTPAPIVSYRGTTLTQGTDYTLSWSYNTSAGTGVVTATGTSNYAGSISGSFQIRWATYTVHFNANGGSGEMSDQDFTYNTAQNLTANGFSRTDYTFIGWNTAANGSGDAYTDQQSVSNLTAEPNGTLTLYAQWASNHWQGSGTENNPYMITTPAELQQLSTDVNGGDNFDGKYFKLGNDIDMSGVENFVPIGISSQCPFKGTFDGDNNTISHLNVYRESEQLAGLFGHLSGRVQDVVIANSTIFGGNIIGGIAGYCGDDEGNSYSNISNCRVVSSTITGSYQFVGGIVGRTKNCAVTDCHVVSSTITVNDATHYVGAIVGNKYNDIYSGNTYHSTLVIDTHSPYAFNIGYGGSGNSGHDDDSGAKLNNNTLFVDADRPDHGTLLNAYANPSDYTRDGYGEAPDLDELTATLTSRRLYKDGDWNTLCLPFNATLTGDLTGATLMELDTEGTYEGNKKTGLDGTTLNLYFKNATSISAGKPYIIRWEGTYMGEPIQDPTFTGVTIDKTMHNTDFTGGTFKGTYDPIEWNTENKSILLLGTNNTLYWPQPAHSDPNDDTSPMVNPRINACRAYFDLGSNTAREFKLNFGAGPGSADVSSAIIADGDVRAPRGWYTLDGRKLDGVGAGPVPARLRKGLYIHNGKKVVIK